jgi:hypothetical protein
MRDPNRDLKVSFWGSKGQDAGHVSGSVTNNSSNTYQCVRIEFNLFTRFDMRQPGEPSRHLGVLPTVVRNIEPHAAREYKEALPFPAGFGFRSVALCSDAEAAMGTPPNSIRNFRPVDVSSAELRVSVDYTWSSAGNEGPVFIHATPEEKDGVFDPSTVDFEKLVLRPGTHTVTLKIAKKARARVFTSLAVRVCMSTSNKALLCRDFPHEKRWTDATAPLVELPKPLPAPADPQPVQGRCSISGRLSGPLEGEVSPDHPGGSATRVRLREIFLRPVGAETPLRARIENRRYIFRNLKAGVVYEVLLVGFQSKPLWPRAVTCRASQNNRVDFQIIGPLGH